MDVKLMHDSLDNLKQVVNEVVSLQGRVAVLENLPTPVVKNPSPVDIAYDPNRCGINIPYINFGNDIISHARWGIKSLAADPAKAVQLVNLFKAAKDEGFNTVRFWLFPTFWHNKGQPYTTEQVMEAGDSVDRLCNAAEAAGVKLIPTLLSFDNYSIEKRVLNGAVAPFTNQTDAILARAIAVLGARSDVVDYVDLMNEPEWCTSGIPHADPDSVKYDVQDFSTIRRILSDLAEECNQQGLRYGYGSASMKWKEASLINEGQVDYHAYAWSNRWFPPEDVPANSGYYMGETHNAYADWGRYLSEGKFKKVLLWLEPDDYTVKTEQGLVGDADTLRKTLQSFKQGN